MSVVVVLVALLVVLMCVYVRTHRSTRMCQIVVSRDRRSAHVYTPSGRRHGDRAVLRGEDAWCGSVDVDKYWPRMQEGR